MKIYFSVGIKSAAVRACSESHEGLPWRTPSEQSPAIGGGPDAERYAPVAQLVEQWPFKPLAGGSSPPGRTTLKHCYQWFQDIFFLNFLKLKKCPKRHYGTFWDIFFT